MRYKLYNTKCIKQRWNFSSLWEKKQTLILIKRTIISVSCRRVVLYLYRKRKYQLKIKKFKNLKTSLWIKALIIKAFCLKFLLIFNVVRYCILLLQGQVWQVLSYNGLYLYFQGVHISDLLKHYKIKTTVIDNQIII